MIDAKEYWKQAIEDYLECCNDNIELDDNELERIANELLNDNDVWQTIEEAIDYHIYHKN